MRVAVATLVVSLAIDVTVPSTLGAICGPHCPDGTSSGLLQFVSEVWPRMRYVYGESSLDLWVAALSRWLAFALLAALRLCRRPSRQGAASGSAMLLTPLNADVSHPTREGGRATSSGPLLGHAHAAWLVWTLTVLTYLHGCSKGVARLLQSGRAQDGDGFGLLPLDGSTPPELQFWLCVVAALTCVEVERQAFKAISAAMAISCDISAADESVTGGSRAAAAAARVTPAAAGASDGDSKSAADKAADAATEAKKAYIASTEPKEVASVRIMLGMMVVRDSRAPAISRPRARVKAGAAIGATTRSALSRVVAGGLTYHAGTPTRQ